MEPKKTTQPAPHAGEREKGTREDGEAMPPQAADPKAAPSGKKPPDADLGDRRPVERDGPTRPRA
jgi:hypothetical protein